MMKQVIINGKKYQYLVNEYGNVYSLHTNLKLRHIIDRNGYHMVKLYSGSKKRYVTDCCTSFSSHDVYSKSKK